MPPTSDPQAGAAAAEYDVVIVGAGSAGAPLAARLSENSSRRVLLAEAGPDYRAGDTPAAIRGPNFAMVLGLGRYHWPDLRARVTEWQEPDMFLAGRGVGGTSVINGQGAVRARPADFDGWGAGWSWADVLPEFIKLEDDRDFGDQPYHGRGGPIPITRTPEAEWGAVSAALREAAPALGHPVHEDLNAPEGTGVSPNTWNRAAAGRVTTNDAYLEGARDRSNLTILGEASAVRLLLVGTRVVGVELSTPAGAREVAAGEVIVSAGVIYSPALLMRSGIGPADELRRHGVAVVADLPGVGQGLQDHPMVWLTFPVAVRATSADVLPGHCVLRWNDLEMLPLDRTPMDVHAGGLMVALTEPRSRTGTVRLGDGGSLAVEFRLLAESGDVDRLRTAIRHAADLVRQPAFTKVMDAPLCLDAGRAVGDYDDDELGRWLRARCMPYFHPVGTCRMGDPRDSDTVVGRDGKVVGVEGLRVADASIMPGVPRTPTHLTTVMIAEHIARRFP